MAKPVVPEGTLLSAHVTSSLATVANGNSLLAGTSFCCTALGSQEKQGEHVRLLQGACSLLPDWSRKNMVWAVFSGKNSCRCLLLNYQKTMTCERFMQQEWVRRGGVSRCAKLVVYKKKKTPWEGSVARMGSLSDSEVLTGGCGLLASRTHLT